MEQIPQLEQLEKQAREFKEWFEALPQVDQMNFSAMLTLPNAEKVIAICPDPKYKAMATFGLAMKRALFENAGKEG